MALEDRDERELEQCLTCLQEERAYGLPEVTCKPWNIRPVGKQAASTERGARKAGSWSRARALLR